MKMTFAEYCEYVEEVFYEQIINNYSETEYDKLWTEYINYYMRKE